MLRCYPIENVPRLFPVTPPSEKPKTKGATPRKSEPKKNRAKLPRPSIFDDLKNEKKAEEVVAPIVAPVVEVVSEDDVELEETKAIPWSPQFDHTDDLGGVLRPKGRLLSRAFNFDDTNADGLKREPFDENDIP